MARDEHQRENLLRDAVALVERIEWCSPTGDEVVVGFRASGAASLFLNQDPVYHFNSADELRRAYVGDRLIKADGGKLVRMHRQRPGGEVQLVSHVMDDAATANLLEDVQLAVDDLLGKFQLKQLAVVGAVPTGVDVEARAVEWLAALSRAPLTIAASPHAR